MPDARSAKPDFTSRPKTPAAEIHGLRRIRAGVGGLSLCRRFGGAQVSRTLYSRESGGRLVNRALGTSPTHASTLKRVVDRSAPPDSTRSGLGPF
jgi:hypothetical protein